MLKNGVLLLCLVGLGLAFTHGTIPSPVYKPTVGAWPSRPAPFQEFKLTPQTKQLLASQRNRVVQMFNHAYQGYTKFASGYDELNSVSCTGSNEFGGLQVSFIEAISTIMLLDDPGLFRAEIDRLLVFLNDPKLFDKDVTVSVFESTIRILGPLLSIYSYGNGDIPSYGSEQQLLLPHELAIILKACTRLADKLLPAFHTPTGIPYAEINLKRGVLPSTLPETLVSSGGSFLLEFYELSRLSKNQTYIKIAEKAANKIFSLRDRNTNLIGSRLNIATGEWYDPRTTIAGGVDSYLEYLLKYSLVLKPNVPKDYSMWNQKWNAIFYSLKTYAKIPPYWIDVKMDDGKPIYPFFYSLGAYWPGVLALSGALNEAEENFEAVMSLWQTFGGLPEIQNILHREANPLVGHQQYYLRPEMAESAFILYQLTKDPKYQYAGYMMIEAIEQMMKTSCGYTILESVVTKEQGNKMPSYFFSETVKYLYLLFDEQHPLFHQEESNLFERVVFSTEGQIFPLLKAKSVSWGYNKKREEL